MSMKNRMLLDKDFAMKHSSASSGPDPYKKYPFRLAGNRLNALGKKPHWDVYWPGAISTAIRELDADHVNVNGGTFFRTAEILASVKKRAEEIWQGKIDKARVGKSFEKR